MLQRGTAQGKHDIEDARAVLNHAAIDRVYLQQRIAECGCATRVAPFLHDLGLAG